MDKNRTPQTGQAATEFLIAAVFLLVPLFLIIPLLGKYIDIKHAAIGLARYSAWEQTVWSLYHTNLFFGDPNAPDYGVPDDADSGNPTKTLPPNPLWRDHRGTPLFTLADPNLENGKTPVPKLGIVGEIAEGFLDLVGEVFATFGKVLKKIHVDGNADFFDNNGYYTSKITLKNRSLDQIIPRSTASEIPQGNDTCKDHCLEIRARAAVIADNWNARSPEHADTRSRGLVPTAVLSPLSTLVNDLIKPINKGLSHVPGFNIKLPAVPEFGHFVDDLIPYEHYYDNKMKLQEKKGLSSYEDP